MMKGNKILEQKAKKKLQNIKGRNEEAIMK
jgi:hypothetical protein